MPQIKTITVNNGTADVTYVPAGSSATATFFMNRGSSLRGGSKIASNHPTPSAGALVHRQSLVLDKKVEVVGDNGITQRDIALFDLKAAFDTGSSRTEREAAYAEFTSLLADPDVKKSVLDNEAFY